MFKRLGRCGRRKELIWSITNGFCVYCSNFILEHNRTVDHVKPLCEGGKNECENLLPSCEACNHKKGEYFPFSRNMRATNKYKLLVKNYEHGGGISYYQLKRKYNVETR